MSDLNLPEWKIFKKYKDYQKFYPFDVYIEQFKFVDKWVKSEDLDRENGSYFITLFNKAMDKHIIKIRKILNSYLVIEYRLDLIDRKVTNDYKNKFVIVDEILCDAFERYEKVLIDTGFFSNQFIQYSYLSIDYMRKLDKFNECDKSNKYVGGYRNDCDGNNVVRFAVDMDKVFYDLSKSVDRRVECEIFIELLRCRKDNFDIDKCKDRIELDFNLPKIKTAKFHEIDYYVSDYNFCIWPSDKIFAKVEKLLTSIMLQSNIECKNYVGKQVVDVARKIQNGLYCVLQEEINKYDRIDIHKRVLSKLAFYTFEKKKLAGMYDLAKEPLDEISSMQTEKVALQGREQAKNNSKILLYLIECNLSEKRNQKQIIDNDMLDYLIAIASKIIYLQENSDMAYYDTTNIKMIIDEFYNINFMFDGKIDNVELAKRYIKNDDFVKEMDEVQISILFDKLGIDLGISFSLAFSFMLYVRLDFTHIFKHEILPDVFEINKKSLINDFVSTLKDKKKFDTKNIEDAINYWIIDIGKLKTTINKHGETVVHDILPLWERRGRENTCFLKPIFENKNNLIFSPIMCNELYLSWFYALKRLYPPYEYGLNLLCEEFDKIQKQLEKQLEIDVATLFEKEDNMVVKRNHNFDEYTRPNNIGDYDVIAIDKNRNIIYNVECKFVGYVGNIAEFMNYQKRFFFDKKNYKEKFEKRILFLEQHKKEFLNSNGVYDAGHKLKNIMVTNKVFYSITSIEKFDILSFYELKKEICTSNIPNR